MCKLVSQFLLKNCSAEMFIHFGLISSYRLIKIRILNFALELGSDAILKIFFVHLAKKEKKHKVFMTLAFAQLPTAFIPLQGVSIIMR